MTNSNELFNRAQQVIPGGVNSPVRAFKGVGGTPVFIQKAQGAYIYDTDGKQYIDYVGSWGPMVLVHQRHRKSTWPNWFVKSCHQSKWSAWSVPAQKQP